jgi:hypothetical protein
MTCISVFLFGLPKWMSVIQGVLTLFMFYTYVKWEPSTGKVINMVRSGGFASIFYMVRGFLSMRLHLYSSQLLSPQACLGVFLAFTPGIDSGDPSQLNKFQNDVTIALWVGIVPAGLLGALASYLRLRFFTKTLVERFRQAKPGMKTKFIYKFTDSREVEIVSRCCRKWTDEDTLDPEAVKLGDIVIRAGIQQLPNDPYMIILYSSYLIDVLGSYQSGYGQLQIAKKAQPK